MNSHSTTTKAVTSSTRKSSYVHMHRVAVSRPEPCLANIIAIVRAYRGILPSVVLYRRLRKSPVDFQPRLLIPVDRGRGIYYRRFHSLE